MKPERHGPRWAIPYYVARIRGEAGCSVLITLELAVEQARCYLSTRPQGVVDIEYGEQCAHCRGMGYRFTKRCLIRKGCKACNGAGEWFPELRLCTYSGNEWSPLAR